MSTSPPPTARCMSGRTAAYESRVMTKGSSVVTPPVTACRLSVAQSEANDWALLPRCTWVSMRPGSTGRPPASSLRRAVTVSPGARTATILPSRMANPQSTMASGFTTRAHSTKRSTVTGSGRAADDVAVRVGAPKSKKPPEVPRVIADLRVDVGVEDLVFLVAGAPDDGALGIDEHRGAEVRAVGGAADVTPDFVDAADVEHVGDGVAAELDLPHLADPVAVRRRGDDHEVSALEPELSRRLREVAVVADQDPEPDAPGRVEDREAQVPRREEEPLVGRCLARLHRAEDLRDRHLAVLAHEAAVRAEDSGGVVERAVVVLVERVDDDGPGFPRHPGQPVHRRAGDGLRGLEPLPVAREAEVNGGAQLREADDLGTVAGGLPGQILGLPDVGLLGLVTAELHQGCPDHRRRHLPNGMRRFKHRTTGSGKRASFRIRPRPCLRRIFRRDPRAGTLSI